jgi:hypothetical protein
MAVCNALNKTTTTATATRVGETPGTTGYGGKVTVGRPNVVGVVGAAAMAIRALGAPVVSSVDSSVVFSVASTGELSNDTCSVGAAVCVSTTGVAVGSTGVTAGFFSSVTGAAVVSAVDVVVPVAVSVAVGGVDGSVVGAVFVGVVPVDVPSCDTVVPEPPDALTDEVGPSPAVVVVVV